MARTVRYNHDPARLTPHSRFQVIPALALTTAPIEKIDGRISPKAFQAGYIDNGGRPVILERAGILFAHDRTLTFDYLRNALGRRCLIASAPQFSGRSF